MFNMRVANATLIYSKFKMNSCEALSNKENVRRPTTWKLLCFPSVVSTYVIGRRYEECAISKFPQVTTINLLKPTGHVMHQQFNIQQLYVLPHTVFMCFVFI